MSSSPENTLTNFDLDLLLSSATSSLSETTHHDYQTQNMWLAGSKNYGYQMQSMGITGSKDHGFQVQNMEITESTDQVYQLDNIGITGCNDQGIQLQNMDVTGSTDRVYQVQNNGITGSTEQVYRAQNITESMDEGYQGQITENSRTTDSYQTQNMGIRNHYKNQNKGNIETINYDYQVQNIESDLSFPGQVTNAIVEKYQALERDYRTLRADFVSLQNDYDSKNKDYDAVKKQYAKLASDYVNLHKENKEHAMTSLNMSTRCDSLEKKEAQYMATITELKNQCDKFDLDIYAQSKQFLQYQSHVEDLNTEINNLKNCVKTEKNIGRDSRKMISTLTNTNKTLADHLCLFACCIEGRKKLDRDTHRLIKKYCKMSISSSKKNAEGEGFENQSVDTGRGSSLAFSDGERSFHSPTYSITFSPLNSGNVTPRNEQIKMMRDAASSPPPRTRTIEISTSPIILEGALSRLAPKTSDAATCIIIHHEDKCIMAMAKTREIASSPIDFSDARTPVVKTFNVATSPIMFDTNTSMAYTSVLSDTSPIRFDELRSSQTDTTTTPIMFEAASSVSKAKFLNIATSPLMFEDASRGVEKKMTNTAISPILFEDASRGVEKKMTNTAISPIMFEDASQEVKKKTSNTAVSPIMFEDASKEAKKKTSNTATSPILFRELRNTEAKLKTQNIATSPIIFAEATTSVAQTKSVDSDTSPMGYAKDPVNRKALPIHNRCAKPQTSGLKTKILRNTNSTTEYFKPGKSLSNSSSHHTEHKKESPATMGEKLKEVASKQLHFQNDAENDWEIKMILCKQKMNWGMLSPMSVTPEMDHENEQTESNDITKEKSSSTDRKEVFIESNTMILPDLSEDDDSENEIDRDDCHIRESPVENLQHVAVSTGIIVTGDNVFDSIKNAVVNAEDNAIKDKTSIENIVSESANEVLIIEDIKKNKSHETYATLTNLQKTYEANVPKSKIKSQHLPVKKQHLKPKPYSISPNRHHLSNNHKDALISKKQNAGEVYKESIQSSFKEPQLLHKPKSSSADLPSNNTSCLSSNPACPESVIKKNVSNNGLHAQTNLSQESDTNKKTCMSAEIQSYSVKSHTLPNPPENDQKKKVLNNINVNLHTRTKPLPVSCPKKRVDSTDTSSHHTSTILKESSNSKNEPSKIPTEVPSIPMEINSDSDLVYSNPKSTIKRISRVRKEIASVPITLPITQEESIDEKMISTSDNKLKRPANDPINDKLIAKRRRVCIPQQNVDKSDSNIETSDIVNDSMEDTEARGKQTAGSNLSVSTVDPPKSSDASNTEPAADNADSNDTTTPACGSKDNIAIPECWAQSLLDRMVYKYGSKPGNFKSLKYNNELALKIKTGIDKCVKHISDPEKYAEETQSFVKQLVVKDKHTIMSGLMKYLNDPARKAEFIPGTKVQRAYKGASQPEMALIDVLELLDKSGTTLWDLILDSSEFILFTLERGATPGFDVIESVAHFYAIICRYRRNISRLWMFMLNAMYCLSFKAIPVMKHCLDVVPEVLPYANTNLNPEIAPLIRCFVFLLNFYNCDDPFKRVEELRRRLKYNYYYNLQEDNETTLLFLLKQSIVNLSEKKLERDMLELSYLIVAKRKGTKWCHKNIVQKILLPMIKGEIDVSYRAKRFCVTTIGHIMKPYNSDMTVHTEEVANLLINIFTQESQPHEMKEDIIRGLLNMNMNTISERINTCLFNWKPPFLSPELEEALENYVNRKHIKYWHAVYQNYYKEI